MKMEAMSDNQSLKPMIDLCYDAVIQLRDLLQKMNAKRLYATEPYLPSQADSKGMLSLNELEQEP